jgi:hypothetical protein
VNLTVGQKVRVIGRYHYPTSDETAEVVKLGRKYATVAWGPRDNQRDQFDMETGYIKGDHYGNTARIKTLEEAAADDRLAEAMKVLSDAKVRFDYGCPLSAAQREELAGIVKHMLSEKPADYESEIGGDTR